MSLSISKLNKLRGRGAKELMIRTHQELSKMMERRLGFRTSEISDDMLRNEFGLPASSIGGGAHSSSGLPGIADIQKVVELINSQFHDEATAIIDRADKARNGYFDLLGLKDLNFGNPVDWHLEPVSGKRMPLIHWSELDYLNPLDGGDQKILWELNRHAHFITLGQAYILTKDETYVRTFVDHASSWMDSNPPAMGVNWSSSLEVSFRAIAWLWAFQLFAESKTLDQSFKNRFLKYLIAHGRHIELYLSHFYSPNTHLTGEALGLFYLGALLPELKRADGWRELGSRILVEQLSKQVRDDGVYFEQSSYYHRYTTDFYLHFKIVADKCDMTLPPIVNKKLELLLDHLMWITRPDGSSPFFGDDDGGRLVWLGTRPANDFRDTLAIGAALFNRSDWKYVAIENNELKATNNASELLWLLGSQSFHNYNLLPVTSPQETIKAFPESGYFIARNGWDKESAYLLFDAGPHGGLPKCGHSHADALSIEYSIAGQRWFIDPGTFVYDCNSEARNMFRGTDAHNTVTIDGVSQSIPEGPFSWSQIANSNIIDFEVIDSDVILKGQHDGYSNLPDPVTHTRTVTFAPPQLCIYDDFGTEGKHDYAIHFHFPPECIATVESNQVIVRNEAGKAIAISVSGTGDVKAYVQMGWISECYGERRQAPVAIFKASGVGKQKFITVVSY